MFEVSVEHTFAAGHALRNYRGKCENVHGHNYRVQVTLRGEKLDQTGMLADFVEIKRLLRAVSEPLDHVFLNDMEPFNELNPSAENIAWYICQKMQEGISQENPVEVAEVKVWETDIQSATYRPPSTRSSS
ncbi:MAG TPA: 6-carboxytetrahydropterin synthase QueD [Bryobacteraceae bacterium]|jgi:6-pyruvoyltetrahydropterin/6-carboxytetrahydropterin synthase|nr:6-carboxytetrahydropterin synthase QueD [Bryobacteraceae bacterium]